ncbi:hypothetical protein GALL_520450 [mine drainage metagenome]|uniref:Uncharacterized protein n=1 Tax=mine drainage metagenome TaxID=410659 RepID=A0A1J5P6J5_9ZZZZ
MPGMGGVSLFEGIVETDRWFGPLFTNMRFTRSHMPVRFRADYPLVLAQPVQRSAYANGTLDSMDIARGLDALSPADWQAYETTIVEPNTRPNRPFGAYATDTRKKRHACMREHDSVEA